MNTRRKEIINWTKQIGVMFALLFLFGNQTITQAQTLFQNPDIKAEAVLDTNRILIGDQTQIHLHITTPKEITIHWPIINDTLSKNIEVIRNSAIDTTFAEGGKMIILNQSITISCYDSGFFAIPPFYFLYNGNTDSLREIVESNPLLLEVKNIKVDMKAEIKDIKTIIDEPWTFKETLPYLLIGIGFIIAVLILIYIIRRRKQNKPLFAIPKKPKVPAHITALKKLDVLKNKKLWQSGSSKEFYSELTDIIRAYMEGQMQFGALEMISSEIMEELAKKNIAKELVDDTQTVLQTADLVKFAKIEPLADENDRALNWGYQFVKTTMPKESISENTNNVEPKKNSTL